jgi:hypothetical protein
MKPNEAKLAFSQAMTDMEGGFITSDVCHNYGIMSGCDEGCPALLSGDCKEWKAALASCDLSDEDRAELTALYTRGDTMNIEEIREAIEIQTEFNRKVGRHRDHGISLSDSAALFLLAEIDRLKSYITPFEGECRLGKEPWPDQCCCVCKYQLVDHWYRRNMPEELKTEGKCGCEVIRGWICAVRLDVPHAHSGWPHHSIGCEMFEKREEGGGESGICST